MTRTSPTLLARTILAAGLLSLGAAAIAQPPAPPTGGPQDGPRMRAPETRAELKTRLEARFDRMDANHDGKIDEKDAQARRDARVADRFAQIDTDKNGSISKAEFAAVEERRGPAGAGPMGRDRMGPMGGPMMGHPMMGHGRAMLFHRGGMEGGRFRGPLPFARAPGGPEGKPGAPLTKSDFVNQGLTRFDKADTDHDGKISPAERDAARGAMRGPRERPRLPSPPSASQPGQ
jgi:hypothetical protein